jgi:transposase
MVANDEQLPTPLSDALWEEIRTFLPRYPADPRGGRPRAEPRRIFAGIAFALRKGCGWQSVPPQYGASSTLHRYYREWRRAGVFDRLAEAELRGYDELVGN